MTSIAKLKLISGAGDPDPALAMRMDIVDAAMKLADIDDRLLKVNDPCNVIEAFDDAVDILMKKTKRYRAHLKKRKDL